MKATLLVFTALIALVFAANPCCSPNQWTADILEWDDELDFFINRHTTYDSLGERMRSDNELHHTRIYKSTDIALWQNKIVYRIEGGYCRKYTLTGNFNRICVANNSTLEASITIGSTLKTDLYNFRDRQRSIYMDEIVTSADCIPVTTMLVTPRVRHEFAEVWNVKLQIDASVFRIPDICLFDNVPTVGEYPLAQKMKWYFIHSQL